MSFKRPKIANPTPEIDEPFNGTLKGFSSADPVKLCTETQENMLRELKQMSPKAGLLTCVSIKLDSETESEGESTDTADESEGNVIPGLLTSFFDPCSINYSTEKLKKDVKKPIKIMYKLQIKDSTTTQSETDSWKMYRAGRITSSNCHQAFTFKFEKPARSTIDKIFEGNESMKYGKKSEPEAFKSYVEQMSLLHEDFKATTTDLHINEKFPYLGASPD